MSLNKGGTTSGSFRAVCCAAASVLLIAGCGNGAEDPAPQAESPAATATSTTTQESPSAAPATTAPIQTLNPSPTASATATATVRTPTTPTTSTAPGGSSGLTAFRGTVNKELSSAPAIKGFTVAPTMEVSDTGDVSGNGGCNQYNATMVSSAKKIMVGDISSTRMACSDHLMVQEQAFFDLLRSVRSFAQTESTVTLTTTKGHTMVLQKTTGR